MTPHQRELLESAYATAHMAGDTLSDLTSQPTPLDRSKVRKALLNLRQASSALIALDSLLAGNPEPKRGA